MHVAGVERPSCAGSVMTHWEGLNHPLRQHRLIICVLRYSLYFPTSLSIKNTFLLCFLLCAFVLSLRLLLNYFTKLPPLESIALSIYCNHFFLSLIWGFVDHRSLIRWSVHRHLWSTMNNQIGMRVHSCTQFIRIYMNLFENFGIMGTNIIVITRMTYASTCETTIIYAQREGRKINRSVSEHKSTTSMVNNKSVLFMLIVNTLLLQAWQLLLQDLLFSRVKLIL